MSESVAANVDRGKALVLLLFSFLALMVSPPISVDAQQGRALPTRGRTFAMWWHQPRIAESLALTAEQQRGLDALLADRIAVRRELNLSFRQARAAVSRAARDGDWKGAETAREGVGAAAARLSMVDADLLIDAMRQLTAEQRIKLAEEFPAVLRRPWLVGGPGGFGRFNSLSDQHTRSREGSGSQ